MFAPLNRRLCVGVSISLLMMQIGIAQEPTKKVLPIPPVDEKVVPKKEESKWKPLMEKDSLKGWEITNFGGEGTAEVNDVFYVWIGESR